MLYCADMDQVTMHITDQVSEPLSSISEEFYCIKGMYYCITISYHPQVNGIIEGQNRTTKDYIRKYTDESQNWLELLNCILFSVHIAKYCSTKYTPSA